MSDVQPDPTLTNPLPDDAIVLRGGYCSRTSLREPARRHHASFGVYGLSFFSIASTSVEETAMKAEFPNDMIRATTAARLRAAGFDPMLGGGRPGHVQIVLADLTDASVDALRNVLDPEIPNPAYGGDDG